MTNRRAAVVTGPERAGNVSAGLAAWQARARTQSTAGGEPWMYELEALLEAERAARVKAERANRAKDDFLATLSHELRTPLNAILGWTELLKRGANVEPQVLRGLQVIERNARSQARLIGDLLDTNRILSGKVRLNIAGVSPQSVIAAAVAAIQPAADAKGIELTSRVEGELPRIMADATRLQQVLWNLLSNAVKFTPRGGRVEIRAAVDGERLRITVRDTGRGIASDLLPRLFDRYRQSEDAAAANKGLGLGLAIVKELVELHGGDVQAESPGEGQGATFNVRLPLGAGAESEGSHPRAVITGEERATDLDLLTGVRVLAVEDDADARDLVKRFLEEFGATVSTVSSGPEALAALAVGRYDLLVSDIGMAPMNGYELIRAVRARPASEGGGIPAIALTAFARSEDQERASRAGYGGYVAKPVQAFELVRVAREVLDGG